MALTETILVLFAAILVLIVCSGYIVKKISMLFHYYGFSSSFAGLSVLALVTSLPEIFSHVVASLGILSGHFDYQIVSSTVLGANIGSDVVQQTLILGVVVLFSSGFVFKKNFIKPAYAPMIGTTLMCLLLGFDGTYSRIDGLILFGTFVAYMVFHTTFTK